MSNAAATPLLKGLDLVVDFATLGEYRVVTEVERRPVKDGDVWAEDIEWSAPPRRRASTETTCSLPRARDRRFARERVRG